MDTIEQLHRELEDCIDSITAAGLGNLNLQHIETLDTISAAAAALGMNQGKKLIDNFASVLRSFKEGKSPAESVSLRLTALNFYLKNTRDATATGEL
ncbi:MAG: hypothetical protein LBD47_02635 [Treponema sp.]|jgi:hypothetical protein|nr:hypothetical protein [Treponema sp.]